MAQGLLDHYVLPYLPPEDVEARRERAREVRDKAAKRAADARRPPPSFPGPPGFPPGFPGPGPPGSGMMGGMGGMAAASAALAHVFGRGSGISSVRVSGAANVNALQHLLESHGRRVTRVSTDAPSSEPGNPAGEGFGASVDGSDQADPVGAMVNSLRATNDLLRGLTDSNQRREEQVDDIQRQTREAEAAVVASQARLAELQRAHAREQGVVTTLTQTSSRGTAGQSQSDRARVSWTAVSSEVNFPTPCAHCTALIPPCFLRLRRSEVLESEPSLFATDIAMASTTEMTDYFHPNFDCLRAHHSELRGMAAVEGLSDLSEQERRVITALRVVLRQDPAVGR